MSTAATAQPQRIDPRTTPVLCLPPGWRLLCLEGRVGVRSGPLVWGQVLLAQQRELACGQLIEGGHDGMPVWLHLHSLDSNPVQLQLLEPAPQPSWVAGLYAAVRRLLGRQQPAAA
ncbi:hypothetical protein [Comamonas sp. GB3 AK4-5]|uniref:hypothetical protein n=1 Tax=Comamonas sp. GB3 AK4-5 TaxID=3231487 RepID=UPI00351ECA3C